MREYREKNRRKLRTYNREYNRLWRKKNGYYNEEKWKKVHKIAVNAEKVIQELIRKGRVKRLPCAICGEKNTVAHHPDYAKPVEVVFLCYSHHRNLHYGKRVIHTKLLTER